MPGSYYAGKAPNPMLAHSSPDLLAGFPSRVIYEEVDWGLECLVRLATPREPLTQNYFFPLSAINTEIPLFIPSFFSPFICSSNMHQAPAV